MKNNEPFQNEQRPNVIRLGSGVTESYKFLARGTKQEEFDMSLTGLSDQLGQCYLPFPIRGQ